ncbi:MAG TPA: flagellar biosynthesis protein FliQ [Myxococcales bacterium]|nr:flagellar biosynthesis protein FliQ [Myxococcales bacterium]
MNQLIFITQEALYLVLVCSGPPVVISLVVGLIIAVFQATTQIQEQTLTFAPKMVIVFGVLALLGSWMGSILLAFAFQVFDRFPEMIAR